MTDLFLGQRGEPAFELIDSGRRSGREQRGRTVAHVVMGASFGDAGGQSQNGLSTIQCRLQCAGDHGIDPGIVDRPWCSGARHSEQSLQALPGGKPTAPLQDRLRRDSTQRRHLLVVPAVSARKHHLRTHVQGYAVLRRRAPASSCSRFASFSTICDFGLPPIASPRC